MKPLLVIGGGGFGREVLEIVAAVNVVSPTWDVVGVLDDDLSDARRAVESAGARLVGPVADLAGSPAAAVIAIGSPGIRARIAAGHAGTEWATLVHPHATVGRAVSLGPGSVIAPGARLSTAISTGAHLQVDQNATIGHDAVLGDFVRLNPQACVSGAAAIRDRVLVGAAAVVLEGRVVGADAVVGAGSVVTRDVRPRTVVKGVPAR